MSASNIRVILDEREGASPGFKFNDWEMRGVPLRIEIGPKDVQKNTVVLARRDKPGKRRQDRSCRSRASLDAVSQTLDTIQKALYERALNFRESNTANPKDYSEFKAAVEKGFAMFILVRQRAMRKKHQGRDKGHVAVHSPGAIRGERRLHLLRQACNSKSVFRQSLLIIPVTVTIMRRLLPLKLAPGVEVWWLLPKLTHIPHKLLH